MITFKDDNKLIELSINDYQYPEITEGYYDCDWLNAHLHANDGKQQWNKNDSAFLTFELTEMADWFETLAKGKNPEHKDLRFYEPCVAFKYKRYNDFYKITVVLEAEFLPPGMAFEDSYKIEFKCTKAELATIALNVKSAINKYPVRGDYS